MDFLQSSWLQENISKQKKDGKKCMHRKKQEQERVRDGLIEWLFRGK